MISLQFVKKYLQPQNDAGPRRKQKPVASKPYRHPQPQHKRRRAPKQGGATLIAYHGTPTQENAASIVKDGWLVGSGNALGDGIYLATKVDIAKTYAGSSGLYLKCRVLLGRSCAWDSTTQARYKKWCQDQGVRKDNSAITAYLLQHGFHTVRQGDVIVVLAPQYANATAWKRRFKCIRIMSVHRSSDDQRIRV